MSGVASKYACLSCSHVAYNRRMLAHHVAMCHATKVYKCPLCPFISSYQANLYRHKRLIHRQPCSSKPNDSSDSPAPTPSSSATSLPSVNGDQVNDVNVNFQGGNSVPEEVEATLTLNNGLTGTLNGFFSENFQLPAPLPVREAALINESGGHLLEAQSKTQVNTQKTSKAAASIMPRATPSSMGHLTPVRFKRTYTCVGCDLSTTNPREYLAHQRDVHMERIHIYECDLCMYASKNIQKLQRHYGLIHKEAPKTTFLPQATTSNPAGDEDNEEPAADEEEKVVETVKSSKGSAQLLKCSKCLFTTRSKFLLSQHEKNDHLKRKFFRCTQCGYVTNERGRYTKHVKYHSMPKQKCTLCDFETPYKWNMDRHIKYHYIDGEYKCSRCSFTAEGPKSLAFHATNHHKDGHTSAANNNTEDDIEVVALEDDNEREEQVRVEEDEEEVQNDSEDYVDEDGDQLTIDVPSEMSQGRSQKTFSTRRQTLPSEKKLKCKFCTYCTAWHSDLRRHEIAHKASKKHQCPLCGIGFDSLALVSRHLGRMHRQDSEARNIASMIQLLTNKKKAVSLRAARARSSTTQMPVLQRADSKNSSTTPKPSEGTQSYLNPPLIDAIAPIEKSQVQGSSLKRKASFSDLDMRSSKRIKSQHGSMTCNVCGYRTRWISELEKHMRVHSEDKPFSCPYCEYSSKWKGDLTRHVQKYHEKPSRSSKSGGEKAASPPSPHNSDHSLSIHAGKDSLLRGDSSFDEDGPLDLSLTKPMGRFAKLDRLRSIEEKGLGFQSSSGFSAASIKTIDVVDSINSSNTLRALLTRPTGIEKKNVQKEMEDGIGKDVLTKQIKKYKCPFCSFLTRTASRFHVHIIQHYNRKPFMCSVCGKKSNWQWDISKHIKINAGRDDAHKSACVLLTDESGRKNYDKYDKYLVHVQEKVTESNKSHGLRSDANPIGLLATDDSYEQDQQQFSVTGSQAPENIVVTPDISFVSGDDSGQEGSVRDSAMANQEPTSNGRQFKCSHCDYTHHEKKVVVGHLSVHAGISPYRCRICGFMSNWRQVMMRHIKGRHSGRLRDLQECFSFVQENDHIRLLGLIENDKKEVPSKPMNEVFECKICPYKCDKPYFLRMHMQMHQPRDGANYRCKYCPYYVKYSKNLYRHTRMHKEAEQSEELSPRDKLTATRDGASNSFQSLIPQMDADVLMDSEASSVYKTPKRYACEVCPYQSNNKTYLLYHKQFHRPNKSAPFKCQFCSYWAYYLHLLKQHERVHQRRPQATPSSAPTRSEPVVVRATMQSVRPVVTSEPTQVQFTVNNAEYDVVDLPETTTLLKDQDQEPKLFKCRYCPMTNKRLTNVKSHEKMHWKLGSWMHSCHLCSYRCGNRGVLTAHIRRVHKQYASPIVPKTAAGSSSAGRDSNEQADKAEVSSPRKARFTYYCEHCPAAFKSHSDYSTHSSFHGANLPFSCPYCSYKARHKPHLHKHLIVHTAEYIAKRAVPPSSTVTRATPSPAATPSSQENEELSAATPSKSADQMLLLEETETKAYVTGQIGRGSRKLYKCPACPAVFTKSTILSFHKTLHENEAEHKCNTCSYATNSEQNFKSHQELHVQIPSPMPVTNQSGVRQFPCAKCPASFSKISRYNRHVSLHGQNNRFKCDECDYSVVNSANLVRHKKVHLPPAEVSVQEVQEQTTQDQENTFKVPDNAVIPILPEKVAEKKEKPYKTSPTMTEKLVFGCGRCPYTHHRKDAVLSHMGRHSTCKGIKCPHCDYYTLHPSYITEHMKKHFQPPDFYKAEAYVRYESMEIWMTINGCRELLCKDAGSSKSLRDRFEPPIQDNDLYESLKNASLYVAAAREEQHSKQSDIENEQLEEPTSADNKELMIKSAIEQSKQLEVVLTDVFVKVKSEGEEEPQENSGVGLHHTASPDELESSKMENGQFSDISSCGDNEVQLSIVKKEVLLEDEHSNRLEEGKQIPPNPETSARLPPEEPKRFAFAEPAPTKSFLDNEETMPYDPESSNTNTTAKEKSSDRTPITKARCAKESLEVEELAFPEQEEEEEAESDEYPEMIPMKETIEDNEMTDDEEVTEDEQAEIMLTEELPLEHTQLTQTETTGPVSENGEIRQEEQISDMLLREGLELRAENPQVPSEQVMQDCSEMTPVDANTLVPQGQPYQQQAAPHNMQEVTAAKEIDVDLMECQYDNGDKSPQNEENQVITAPGFEDEVPDSMGDNRETCFSYNQEISDPENLEYIPGTNTEMQLHYMNDFSDLQNNMSNLANDAKGVDDEEMKAAIEKITEWDTGISGCSSVGMDVIVEDLYPQVGDSVIEIVTDSEQPCTKLPLTDNPSTTMPHVPASNHFDLEGNTPVD